MLRQLGTRGFRAIHANLAQLPASLGLAGSRELSGQGCLSAEPAALSPRCNEAALSDTVIFCGIHQGSQGLPPWPTARLQIWRNCATLTSAAAAPRSAIFVASVTSQADNSAAGKAKPRPASATSASTNARGKSSRALTAAEKTSSRASGTAQGRAAARRRPASVAGMVQEARVAAKAKAAESLVKAKELAKKRMALQKARGTEAKAKAVAKVKAEAKEKLRAALEKAKAKAAAQIARLEAKASHRIKRAPTAVNLYIREQVKANPGLGLKEVYQRYKELPEAEKQKYVDQAAAAKAEKQRERDQLKAERGARRAKTSFMFFSEEQRPVVVAANRGMSVPEVATRLGEMWRGLSAEQRQKYVEMSEADRKAKELDRRDAPAAAGAATTAQPQQL
ncbi:high mobility group box 3 [Pleodorina starrii]|uniref:High mobility group box 3 n=1 Tax=Pleodorina starrii TaxID=330485 RepID=A0A9W6BDN3_9CHLO|nr:high mobility group box 3 [Pleodorina starrii]GLC50246.1 high mobility group box 3 [Pleodorina starrii]GLC64372.1 high mobility group box 3 [Pleodorina starrii]